MRKNKQEVQGNYNSTIGVIPINDIIETIIGAIKDLGVPAILLFLVTRYYTNKDKREEDENGTEGIYATPIYVPYRTFSQVENGQVCHYIILHPEKEVGKVRLHFFAIGEDSDEELQIAETNVGKITGNVIQDVKLSKGRIQLRVRFADKMKHSIKLSAEEYEVQ